MFQLTVRYVSFLRGEFRI